MKTVFVCDFCPQMLAGRFNNAETCQSHELSCEYNPGNRTCATCRHLDFDERARTRGVRAKCTQFGDRKYRCECPRYEEAKS